MPGFATHRFAIDFEVRVLFDEALRPVVELVDRGVGPPLFHVALLVEFTSEVVECVGQLVTHDDPHTSVV